MHPFPVATPIELAGRGVTLATHQAGSGPAVVFCHGFPDLGFGWRYQLEATAAAGFHAIAPDQRGYGASTAPAEIGAYGLTELTGDLVALLDALEIERAWFVGHDWGGFVVWATAVLHPERVLGVGGLCTPYMAFPSVEKHLAVVGGEAIRQYVAWFQEPDVPEAEMDAAVRPILTRIFRSGAPLEEAIRYALADGKLNMNPFHRPEAWPVLGRALGEPGDLDHYCEVYERTGFRGGVNWYRNGDRNAAEHPTIGKQKLDIPCLMLTAERDPGLRPEFTDPMHALCSDLELHHIKKVGHWLQQEVPEEVNARLLGWLARVAG